MTLPSALRSDSIQAALRLRASQTLALTAHCTFSRLELLTRVVDSTDGIPKKKKARRRLKSLGAMVKREEYLANQNHGSLLREAHLVDSVGVNVGGS